MYVTFIDTGYYNEIHLAGSRDPVILETLKAGTAELVSYSNHVSPPFLPTFPRSLEFSFSILCYFVNVNKHTIRARSWDFAPVP